ncbi:MAG: hypothetical protein QOI77_3049 [Blastocatellia bacterium]|jgi:hypothetical protein|nr:hypothetical protein [Blastocatellia bacterium]
MVGLAQIFGDVEERVSFEFMGAWVRGEFTNCNGGEPFAYVRLNLVASKSLIRSKIYRQTCDVEIRTVGPDPTYLLGNFNESARIRFTSCVNISAAEWLGDLAKHWVVCLHFSVVCWA